MLMEKVLNKLVNTEYWRQSYTQWDVISYLKKYSNDTKEERRAYGALGTELKVLFENLKPRSKEGQKVRILKRQLKELKKSNRRNKENVVPPVEPVASVASKRNFVEIQVMQVDKTALICEALIQSFDTIPNQAHGLISLIDASLIRKLPVSFHEESKYPQLAEYIQTSDDECESSLAKHISCILTSNIFEKQILDGTSEDMLHWAIDSLIRIPLQIFRENLGGRVLPIEMDRNSKDQGTTTISNKRPDFLCWTNGVLIFKGEEKAEIDDFPVAVRELTDKFNKFDPLYFGDIQFMICYVVAGSKLCFYAINGPSNTNPLNHLVPLSNLLDIKNSRDRISILSIIVNIARIIRTVSNTISSTIVPIGKRLKLERSTITFFDVRRVTCKFVWKFQSGISIPSMFSLLIIRYNRRIGSNNIQRYKLNCLNPIQDEKGLHSEEMCLHVAMEISALGGKIKKSTVQAFYERNIKKKNDYISILAELVYG